MTNRLGDMLKEMRDPNLSPQRENEIVRILNEESERLDTYKSWLQADKKPRFEQPTISNPKWGGRAILHPLQVVLANTAIAKDTNIYIPWSTTLSENKGDAFTLDPTDTTIIHVNWGAINFGFIGTVNWASDPDGYRLLGATYYDNLGNSLGSQNYCLIDPSQTVATYIPVADAVFAPSFQNLGYFRFYVFQNSGASLNLDAIRLTFFLI